MVRRPLWNALVNYQQEGVRGFHMPGHGQGRGLAGYGLDPALDVTEIPGLDDLHTPTEVIAEAQQAAARAFGSKATFFLVQGATVGIHALCLAGLRTENILVLPRHCHRSVFGGLVLSGATPKYIAAVCEAETGLPVASDTSTLHQLASRARTLLALRPSYWGTVEDLAPWLMSAKSSDIPLWVDEAHGAAFTFCSRFPASALRLGADAVVHGSHKTLPALTQAAMLHIGEAAQERKSRGVSAQNIGRALSLLQTTSPSYLLLASLDLARAQMEENGEVLWAKTLERAERLRKKLNTIKGIYCWGEEIKAYAGVKDWDATRLMIVLRQSRLTGYQVRQILRQEYGIEAELAGPNYLLFMLSPFNHPEADIGLLQAFHNMSDSFGKVGRNDGNCFAAHLRQEYQRWPKMALTPREAFFARSRSLAFHEAKNCIAAEFICPYPPGIPLVAPGEVITPEVWTMADELRRAGARWQGAANPKLDRIAVIDD